MTAQGIPRALQPLFQVVPVRRFVPRHVWALTTALALLVGCAKAPSGGGSSAVPGDDDDSTLASDDDDSTLASDDDDSTLASDDDDSTPASDDDDASSDPGPLGFVGSPCDSSADCDFDDAVCLTDDFPGGVCTQVCELYCPDRDGHPMTFCVDTVELPASAELGDGDCLSRCDFEYFPETGCREDYGCVAVPRANEPSTMKFACLPNRTSELNDCHAELAARGAAFEPTLMADSHPSPPNDDLTCSVDDPVYLKSPVLGVDLKYYDGSPDSEVLAGCRMAIALADTVTDVLPWDVTALRHYGTYNCRVIGDTSILSEHAFANAIDIYGFEFADGSLYTLVDDWEHDTSAPSGAAAAWLYEAAYRWHDADLWNIILTPNYNLAHDDHFHVDLTSGSNFIGVADHRYIGPAPYAD